MKIMNDFKKRIEDMCKPKEKIEESKEKTYSHLDIMVVENAIDENIFVCIKEFLDSDREYTRTIGANNIEDGSQVAEYRVNALPAGRACFGGYTDKEYNKGKVLYGFADVWYKIYGEPLQAGRKFTKRELLEITPILREKFKNARFEYIYGIQCKNLNFEKPFEGMKYFGSYSRGNQKSKTYEMINDDSVKIDETDKNEGILITIGNKTIPIEISDFLNCTIIKSEDAQFEAKLIDSIGVSRLYSRAKFTPEACKQIIKNYEKEKEKKEETR